jgi:uncharacterized damage-inducible protein DinB
MHEADLSILRHCAAIRDVTVELLRALPEGWLERPLPGGDGWTVRRAFLHIAAGQSWWLSGLDGQPGIGDEDLLDAAGIEKALRDTGQRMLDFFGSSEVDHMGPLEGHPHVGRDVVLYLTAHEIHHRGTVVRALWEWDLKDIPFEPREQPLDYDPLEGELT